MSQPDIAKTIAEKWEAARVQALHSLEAKTIAEKWEAARVQALHSIEASRQAWAIYVDPKARELQQTLKLKMEETQKFMNDKAASFSSHK